MSDTSAAAAAVKRSTGSIVVSVVVLIVVFGWLIIVATTLGDAPVLADDKKTVLYDQFLRSKEIFALILPLLTTAVGFWLGSQGTVAAQKTAAQAQGEAQKAHNETQAARRETQAVIAVGPGTQAGDDILEVAKRKHPEMFS